MGERERGREMEIERERDEETKRREWTHRTTEMAHKEVERL